MPSTLAYVHHLNDPASSLITLSFLLMSSSAFPKENDVVLKTKFVKFWVPLLNPSGSIYLRGGMQDVHIVYLSSRKLPETLKIHA